MVLPLVSCWWCSLLILLRRERNNQPLQSVVTAGGGWQRERHRLNSSTSLSQPCLPKSTRFLCQCTTVSSTTVVAVAVAVAVEDNLLAKAACNESVDGGMR
jgi:hypothetical protein